MGVFDVFIIHMVWEFAELYAPGLEGSERFTNFARWPAAVEINHFLPDPPRPLGWVSLRKSLIDC